jgi:hypothetical protein
MTQLASNAQVDQLKNILKRMIATTIATDGKKGGRSRAGNRNIMITVSVTISSAELKIGN